VSPSANQEPSSPSQQGLSSGLSDFFRVQVEDQLRLQRPDSPTAPVTTKLNVFTAKVGSSRDLPLQTARVEEECVLCQLWGITNPGENLKCNDCTQKSIAAFGAVEQSKAEPESMYPAPQVETSNTLQLQLPPNNYGKGQCSACGISTFMNQGQVVTCSSCSPDAGTSSPESSSNAFRVKRSCAQRPPTKLESHALRCLKTWLRDHSSNPYPDADTKRTLAQQCGITEKQVTTWFTNARARQRFSGYARSLSSGLEGDGQQTNRLSMFKAAPILKGYRGLEESHHSGDEYDQVILRTSRRGKKKDYSHLSTMSSVANGTSAIPSNPAQATTTPNDNTPNMWQCTFCYQTVAPKSWRRHEETQHRPKRKWTCLHTGPSLSNPSCPTSPPSCVFCTLQNPSEEHLRHSHRIIECMAKSEEERTFLRPDHLRQHVKNFHHASLSDAVRDLWRRDGLRKDGLESWTCGFCALEMNAWDARQAHIAAHFKNGKTMAEWKVFPLLDGTAPAQANRKRPTSSEGRPNVLSKLARTFTGLTTRQRDDGQQYGLYGASASTCGYATDECTQPVVATPLLPDLVFDDFTTGVYGGGFDFGAAASVTDSSEGEGVLRNLREVSSSSAAAAAAAVDNNGGWFNLNDLGGVSWKEEYSDFLDFW
jgi:hypothetical protein